MPNLCINLKTIHYPSFTTTILQSWTLYIHTTLAKKKKTYIFFQDLAQILEKTLYIILGCKRGQKFHQKSKIYHTFVLQKSLKSIY